MTTPINNVKGALIILLLFCFGMISYAQIVATNGTVNFTGNGGGLTNLSGTNVVGTLTNNTMGSAGSGWPIQWPAVAITNANWATNGANISYSQLPYTPDTNGAGTAAAELATNGLPSDIWTLGTASQSNTNAFDLAGTGVAAAQAATNGYPWGSLYDAAGAASNGLVTASNAFYGISNPSNYVTATITNGFNPYGFTTPKFIGITNYPMVSGDHDIYGAGTNQLLTLLNNVSNGYFVLVGLTNANGSIIITNPIGSVIQSGVTSRTMTNGQHAFLRTVDGGTNWW